MAELIPDRAPWSPRPARRRLPVRPLDHLVGPLLRTAAVPIGDDAPGGLAAFVTAAGFLGRMTRWQSDVTGSGVGFDAAAARGASIGEAVERYCGNFVPTDRLRLASESDLIERGEAIVDHGAFGANRAHPGPAAAWFRPHDPTQPEYWLAGRAPGHPGAATTLLPAEAVVLNFTRSSRRQALFPVVLAGIAAGTSPASAALAATLELVERDATMVWWYGGRPAERITDLPERLAARVAGAGSGGGRDVDLWFLRLPAAVPVTVVAACLHDRRHDILVTGFAARAEPATAVAKAAAEAWQLRHLSRLLLDAGGPLWPEISSGRLPLPVVAHRPDRSYADAFRPDRADLHQLAFHLQYFLDPRTHPAALVRLRPGNAVRFADLTGVPGPACGLAGVVAACREASIPLWAVDLTTADMAACGYSVQRVVAPSLVGNTPAAFVPSWHPRLAPVAGGGPLTREPMPHA
jgi:ribosomal protein S12 methylthiotransferase accessory factor